MGWGDELIVTGQVRELQGRDPRRVRIVYERKRWHEAWFHNPRIAHPDESGDFQELRPRDDYRRPYIAQKEGDRWTWRAWGPPRGELYFDAAEVAFGAAHGRRIVIEPTLKAGASPNKDWGHGRWKAFIALAERAGLKLTQLGPPGTRVLPGVEWIRTDSMRLAAAVLANARAAALHEGAMHHAAAALSTPAAVIFGGYISPKVTGYEGQKAFFTGGGLGCGLRVPCEHCRQAMAAISSAAVFEALEEILDTNRRSVVA